MTTTAQTKSVTAPVRPEGAILRARRQRRPVRGNRLDERVAIGVAVVSGAAAALAAARPTGSTTVDVVLVGFSVGFVTWAAASAPWWAVAGVAGVAAVVAIDPVLTLVAAAAFVAGLWIGVRRRDLGTVRTAVAAVALNVLIRSELEGFHGVSAAIGITVAVALFHAGIHRRRRHIRRAAWTIVAVVATATAIAVIGFGVAATAARARLLEGNRLARQGIAELGDGDFDAAAASFGAAAAAFSAADNDLSQPWTRAASLVPVVAQNGEAVGDLAASAASTTSVIAAALERLEPEQLRFTGGRIDPAAFDSFHGPLVSAQRTLADLRATIDEVESPWLIAPLANRIDGLDGDIAENEEPLENAILATELAPELFGTDGSRRYLVAFTTPAEARGLGGFMGNFAEFVADDGRLRMSRFGRTGELNSGGDDPLGRTVSGPREWLDRWGRYGFDSSPEGTTGAVPWSNVTMSPDFPSTAAVMAELYPQSGGRRLDGVFAMDPYVLAALVELTGPIELPSTGATLEADEVAPFLLRQQYRIDEDFERVDLLEDVARQTVDRVLGGSLPAPTELADTLGRLAHQGRLVGWSADAAEQRLFERVGMAGELPDLAGGDGVAVVVNNAAANKIDTYLERDVRYRATVDPATGQTNGTLEVTLTNTAPATGLPQVVIGNTVDEPRGTNRALVSIYTALPVLSGATIDGAPLQLEPGREQGWVTSRALVTIPPGGSRTITLHPQGVLNLGDGYSLTTRPQPLVAPERHDLAVTTTDGEELVAVREEASVPRRIEAEGS